MISALRPRLPCAALAYAICSFGGAAAAQPSAIQAQNRMMCNDPKVSDTDTIVGCSNLIKSAHDKKHVLAVDFANRGFAYFNKGDYDHAVADYERAAQIDPKFALAFSGSCAVHFKKGEMPKAIVDCTQAITLDPKLAIAYNNRGLAKQAQGDAAGGAADIARAKELNPEFGK